MAATAPASAAVAGGSCVPASAALPATEDDVPRPAATSAALIRSPTAVLMEPAAAAGAAAAASCPRGANPTAVTHSAHAIASS